jgi:hypothetical protein
MNSVSLLLLVIGWVLIGIILREELKMLWFKYKKFTILYPLLLLLPLIMAYLFSFFFPLEWGVFWETIVEIFIG